VSATLEKFQPVENSTAINEKERNNGVDESQDKSLKVQVRYNFAYARLQFLQLR